MRRATVQKRDGPIRLQIEILGVATALAGAFFVLLQLVFNGVEIEGLNAAPDT
jgi:hypothetical protein